MVKRSAVDTGMMRHTGRARVFECEEEALEAIYKGKSRRGMWWSSGTKVPRAARECGRC